MAYYVCSGAKPKCSIGSEQSEDAYYFTKTGKTFGRDSIYFSGEGVIDCESEGFIRFLDRGTSPKNLSDYKYMGMFNRNGDVAIPAKYNFLRTDSGYKLIYVDFKNETLKL